jgi:hypothetical protein
MLGYTRIWLIIEDEVDQFLKKLFEYMSEF